MKMQNLGNLSLLLHENISKNKKEKKDERAISIDENIILSPLLEKPEIKKEYYVIKLIYSNKLFNLIDAKVKMILN
jgi:hypothetical protein